MKTLTNLNLSGKTVLLRSDLNSDVVNGKVLMSERIRQSVETIKELKRKNAKVVIIAHQGRPGKNDFVSLNQHSKFLNKFTKVKFVDDIIGKKAIAEIQNLKSGEALLLENLRFLKDENEFNGKNNQLIKKLVPLADIYVNDAFSVCHRKQTSIIGFPKYLKSYAGRLLEKEVETLKKIKLKNTLFILGGGKPEENLRILNKKNRNVLACGLFDQLYLISQGFDFGAQNKYLKKEFYLLNKIKGAAKKNKIQTPIDYAVNANGKRKELDLEDFPSKYRVEDIGEKTMKLYANEIKKAGSIFMKGPVGVYENKKFSKGTNAILKAIADSKGFSLIGGGHLNEAIKQSKINPKKFDHVSLSGGALIRYISGEKLPGLEALK